MWSFPSYFNFSFLSFCEILCFLILFLLSHLFHFCIKFLIVSLYPVLYFHTFFPFIPVLLFYILCFFQTFYFCVFIFWSFIHSSRSPLSPSDFPQPFKANYTTVFRDWPRPAPFKYFGTPFVHMLHVTFFIQRAYRNNLEKYYGLHF